MATRCLKVGITLLKTFNSMNNYIEACTPIFLWVMYGYSFQVILDESKPEVLRKTLAVVVVGSLVVGWTVLFPVLRYFHLI